MSRRGHVVFREGQEQRRGFISLFKKFTHKYNDWQVWQDFIYMTAAALSQPCDFRQEREDEYMSIIKKYNKAEQDLFPQMLASIIDSFEQEQFADILGDLYMQLEMGNKWKGQFFTPYHMCQLMSALSAENVKAEIDQKGYMSVNDPCCGGGAMLIAFAEHCFNQEVNYQNHVLFAAQDVDPVVAKMCYIQMSLLGMSGYVIIGNTLTQPPTGNSLFPAPGKATPSTPEADIWYTPFWFSEVWHYRRTWSSLSSIISTNDDKTPDNFELHANPEIREEVPKQYDITFNETNTGQLTLF